MFIKLIVPRFTLRPMDSEFKRLMSPPLGLLTLGALTPDKHKVIIADENVSPVNFNDSPDLVGLTVNVDTSPRAYEISSIYRKKGIMVILGGIHASANPDEALMHADSVCIGEAEKLWSKILADAENNSLQKKYFNETEIDLSSVPRIKYSYINKNNYLYTNIIYTSRNCPFKCEFCYNSSGFTGTYRNKPVFNVIKEIISLGSKHIMFIDDNFIGNIEWTKKFLMILKKYNIKWNAAVSVNLVNNLSLLDLMKESGCMSLFIGFETINQESLKNVNKHQNNINNYEKLIREIHQREIMINASLAFGFDCDTPAVFKDTLEWLVYNKIETMTAHILTPYPGTKLFAKLKSENRITDFNWANYNTAKVVFKPKNMSEEELLNGYLWMYKKFYSFKNIFRRMPENRQNIPYLLFNLFYRKFGKITSVIARLGLMNKIGSIAKKLSYKI